MAKIEDLATAVLTYDSLLARALIQGFYDPALNLTHIPRPDSDDQEVLATSAALLELLALRRGQKAPAWTEDVGPLRESRHLLRAAESMRRLRQLCETESPEPLRKRRLFAPPNFLEFV